MEAAKLEEKPWKCMMCGNTITHEGPEDHSDQCPRGNRMLAQKELEKAEKEAAELAASPRLFRAPEPEAETVFTSPLVQELPEGVRPVALVRRLPDERDAVTHKFRIRDAETEYKGFITVGFYADGTVGEVLIKLHNQGSAVSGFCDAWAIAVSMLLQRGTPLEDICAKFAGMRFEPAGQTGTPGIRQAHSPIDYAVRYLKRRYVQRLPLADEEV